MDTERAFGPEQCGGISHDKQENGPRPFGRGPPSSCVTRYGFFVKSTVGASRAAALVTSK
jgi:hypothetical protein